MGPSPRPRKHERSHAEVDVGLSHKKPRESERASGPLEALAAAAAAATLSEPCDADGGVVRNCSASGAAAEPNRIGAHARGAAGSYSDLEPDEPPGFSHHQPMGILRQDGSDEGKHPPEVIPPKRNSEDKEEVPVDREGLGEPRCSIPLFREDKATHLANTLVNEQVKDFMGDLSVSGILQNRLSELVSLLVQATSISAILHKKIPEEMQSEQNALRTRISELEQQVQELANKLYRTEEEHEMTRAALRGAQADMLEAQSDRATAIATMNSLAMRAGATLARLGAVHDPPPNVVDSLEETTEQLTALMSRIGPVLHSHAMSLARSSLTFGVAALLCRERGVEGLRGPLAGDVRQFIHSQGPDFHSLMGEVVHAIEQDSAEALKGGGSGGSGETNKPVAPTDMTNATALNMPHSSKQGQVEVANEVIEGKQNDSDDGNYEQNEEENDNDDSEMLHEAQASQSRIDLTRINDEAYEILRCADQFQFQNDATEDRFHTQFQQDVFYQVYDRCKRFASHRYISWSYVNQQNEYNGLCQKFQACGLHGLVSMKYDYDKDIIRQFYATIIVAPDFQSLKWMTGSNYYYASKADFQRVLGVSLHNYPKIHDEKHISNARRLAFYNPAHQVSVPGKVAGLHTLPNAISKICRATFFPQSRRRDIIIGREWNVINYIMHGQKFDVVDFIINEISVLRGHLKVKKIYYAPYIMRLIVEMTEYNGPRETSHDSWVTPLKHLKLSKHQPSACSIARHLTSSSSLGAPPPPPS